jgi:hypothetical protein
MNKIKRSVSQKLNKKMRKEIKAAQRPLPPESKEYSDALTPQALLKKYPQKTLKAEKGMLRGLEQRLHAKKSKKAKKHSKRTNCAAVDERSVPAHIHAEGARWIKNTTKQNSIQRRRLQKQLSKQKS